MITLTREEAQQVLDCIVLSTEYKLGNPAYEYAEATLRTRLAQPEPEPVAWMHNFIDYVITKNRPTDITRNAGRWTPLYTAPPAKEWAGLTDDEYELMAEKRVTNYFFNTLDYAHDIEAMLKEKNGG